MFKTSATTDAEAFNVDVYVGSLSTSVLDIAQRLTFLGISAYLSAEHDALRRQSGFDARRPLRLSGTIRLVADLHAITPRILGTIKRGVRATREFFKRGICFGHTGDTCAAGVGDGRCAWTLIRNHHPDSFGEDAGLVRKHVR